MRRRQERAETRRMRRLGALALAASLGWSGLASAQGSSRGTGEIERVEAQVSVLQQQTAALYVNFLQPAAAYRERTLDSRFSEGTALFDLQDFQAASILLVDVVEDPAFGRRADALRARYMLAESFYQTGNLVLARGYFRDVLRAGVPEFVTLAAQRLLEIALVTRDYEGLAELYAEAGGRAVGLSDGQLQHLRGRALYHQGRFADAASVFAGVPATDAAGPSALYWLGVSQARMGQLPEAEATFVRLTEATRSASDEATRRVGALGWLGLGRVLYEQRRWDEALAAYQSVPARTPAFERALFESAWVDIRSGRPNNAIATLRLLRAVAEDPTLGPEAHLLEADLYLHSQQDVLALETFEAIELAYAPLEREFRVFLERVRAADDPLAALLDPARGATRLPEAIRAWVDRDARLERIVSALSATSALEGELLTARELIEVLRAALYSGGAVHFNPYLNSGMAHALEIRNTIVRLHDALLSVEAELLRPGLSSEDLVAYRALESERFELARAFLQSPLTFEAIVGRESEMRAGLRALEIELHELELDRAESLRVVEELRALLELDMRRGERSLPRYEALREELIELESLFRNLDGRARELRQQVLRTRASIGIGDATHDQESGVAGAYRRSLDASRAWLGERRTLGERVTLDRIDRARAGLDGVESALSAFFSELEQMSEAQRRVLRERLRVEEEALVALEARYAEVRRAQGRDAAVVAVGALGEVEDRLSEVTLRANLGVLDVSWREHQLVMDRRDALQRALNESLRVLRSDFADLIGGE